MITIEAPYYLVKGVTILRDHQDADQFYFLPAGVQLAARDNGGLAFTLFEYRVDLSTTDPALAKGGGLALIETEIPPPSLTALQTAVAEQSGRPNARLASVVFRQATAHAIVAHTDGPKLYDDAVADQGAPLTSPFHTAFTLGLTPAGTSLVEQAAKGGLLPIGVSYELRFLVLTPALHAHITMNFDQAWNQFSASFGWTYIIKAQLDLQMSWLVEHDLLKIDITEFTDDADKDRQYQAAMALVTARVQGDFFRSAVPTGDQDQTQAQGPLASLIGNSSGTNVTSATAFFVLKAKYEAVKQTKTFDETWNGSTAIELVHTVSGTLATMMKPKSNAPVMPPDIRQLDASDPFFSSLDGQILGAFDFDAQPDLREAVVTLSHGDSRDAFTFTKATAGPFSFHYSLSAPTDDTYSYTVEYNYDAASGLGPFQIIAGPVTTRDRVLVIDPHRDVAYTAVHVVLGPLDPAKVPRMHVTLVATGPTPALANQTFILDQGHTDYWYRVHLPAGTAATPAQPLVLRATSQWEDPAGGVHDAASDIVTGDTYTVLGPFHELFDVFVVPGADFTQVSQLLATIHYEDGDDVFEQTLTFDATKPGGQHVLIPLMDSTKRTYKWRVATFKNDGTRDDGAWSTDSTPVLVVGAAKPTTKALQVVWVGARGNCLGVRVDVYATDASGAEQQVPLFIPPSQTAPMAVQVPFAADGTLQYRYDVHAETAAGEIEVKTDSATTPLLVITLPPTATA